MIGRTPRRAVQVIGTAATTTTIVMAGATAAHATDVGPKTCRTGADGTVCVAVTVINDHIYARMGLDPTAGSGHTLCKIDISLRHTLSDGSSVVVADNPGQQCTPVGQRIDVLAGPATSRCSNSPWQAVGTYTVNGSENRSIFGAQVLVLC